MLYGDRQHPHLFVARFLLIQILCSPNVDQKILFKLVSSPHKWESGRSSLHIVRYKKQTTHMFIQRVLCSIIRKNNMILNETLIFHLQSVNIFNKYLKMCE